VYTSDGCRERRLDVATTAGPYVPYLMETVAGSPPWVIASLGASFRV
jgi:hypothetical protein